MTFGKSYSTYFLLKFDGKLRTFFQSDRIVYRFLTVIIGSTSGPERSISFSQLELRARNLEKIRSLHKLETENRYTVYRHRLTPREFNSYGARRGNDSVMARGTFANIRLINRLVAKPGPRTVHIPSGEEMDIFDAADLYRSEGRALIVITGKEYGSGSSRDWAAKGPYMLGIKGEMLFDARPSDSPGSEF